MRGRLVRSDDILVVGCTGAACNDGLGRAEVFSGARCAGTVLQRKLKPRLSRQREELLKCDFFRRKPHMFCFSPKEARSAAAKVALSGLRGFKPVHNFIPTPLREDAFFAVSNSKELKCLI